MKLRKLGILSSLSFLRGVSQSLEKDLILTCCCGQIKIFRFFEADLL